MGLFSDIKNFITGGGAKVAVQTTDVKYGEPFTVRVSATATDGDLEISRAYLLFRGHETVEARVHDHDVGDDTIGDTDYVHETATTFREEFTLSNTQTLTQDEEYTWEKEITPPPGAQPPFDGEYTTHNWQVQAGLDVTGNDPDSGWIELHPQL